MTTPTVSLLLRTLTLTITGGHHPRARVVLLALLGVAALWLLLTQAAPAYAAGVVTNCANDVDLRNKLAGGGLVTFNCNGNGSSALITVSRPITLNAGQVTLDGGGKITLSGANARGILHLSRLSALSVTLTHIVLTQGYEPTGGGCLYAFADRVVLDDVTIQLCNSANTNEGAGIYNLFSDLHVVNSRVLTNTSGTGGGIASTSANIISVTNSLIAANHAITGGGLSVRGGTAFITGSSFLSNIASSAGGGLYLGPTGFATIVNSGLLANTANHDGGGIYNSGNRLSLSGSLLSGNQAVSSLGAGIYNQGKATVSDTTFEGNVATFGGGGIRNVGTLVLTQTTFTANATGASGGAVANFNGAVDVRASTLRGNSALIGGAIASAGVLTVTDVTVSGNNAGAGGGISFESVVTLTNVTLSGNTATQQGGGLYNIPLGSGHATLTHVTLSGNAAQNGGGIFGGNAVIHLKSSLVEHTLSGDNCRTSGSGALVSDDYNLSDDSSCTPLFTQAHDLNQTPALLGPLRDNGGPTLTHLPLASSLAVDAIPLNTNGCGTLISTDQRGVLRPQGNAKCDIGAVERVVGELTPLLWLPLIVR
jgi:hypothetical protein